MSLKSVQDKISLALADHLLSESEAKGIIAEAEHDIEVSPIAVFKDEFVAIQALRNRVIMGTQPFGPPDRPESLATLGVLEKFGAEYSPSLIARGFYTATAMACDVGVAVDRATTVAFNALRGMFSF